MRKIETLQTYLEHTERSLEHMRKDSRNDKRADIKKAEQTIQSVKRQLQLQYAEVSGQATTLQYKTDHRTQLVGFVFVCQFSHFSFRTGFPYQNSRVHILLNMP